MDDFYEQLKKRVFDFWKYERLLSEKIQIQALHGC